MQWELPCPKASQCATGAQNKLEGGGNNSGVLCTEETVSKKEVYAQVLRVVVCHGLGDVALKSLTLGVLGERGTCKVVLVWSSWSCRFMNAFWSDVLWLQHPGGGPPQWTNFPLTAAQQYL